MWEDDWEKVAPPRSELAERGPLTRKNHDFAEDICNWINCPDVEELITVLKEIVFRLERLEEKEVNKRD